LSRGIRSLATCRDGSGIVEMAVCLPFIVGLIIPLTDLGMGAYTQMQLINATQAGAEYAAASGFNSTANVKAAINSATALSTITFPVDPYQSCACVTGTTVGPSLGTPPCAQGCGSGTVGTFITVQTAVQYTPLFNYPLISSPLTLTSAAIIRIK
jgi:hypothetical protein